MNMIGIKVVYIFTATPFILLCRLMFIGDTTPPIYTPFRHVVINTSCSEQIERPKHGFFAPPVQALLNVAEAMMISTPVHHRRR